MASAALAFCSTMRMATPDGAADLELCEDLVHLGRKPGRRLVEDQHRRLDHSARPTASIWRWPPESCPAVQRPLPRQVGKHRVHLLRPRESARRGFRQDISCESVLLDAHLVKMFSIWGTKPRPGWTRCCAESGDVEPAEPHRSPNLAQPGDRLHWVDLPAPFGPTITAISPASISSCRRAGSARRLVAGDQNLDARPAATHPALRRDRPR